MHMRMVRQSLPPGVQHQQQPDPGSQVLRVGRDRPDRLGCGPHQGVVHDRRVDQPDRVDLSREGEHDVVVIDRQEIVRFTGEPLGLLTGQALRAVSVPTRVVGDPLVPAAGTLLDVPTEGGCAALRDITQCSPLVRCQAGGGSQGRAAFPDNVSQFEAGSFHRPACYPSRRAIPMASG